MPICHIAYFISDALANENFFQLSAHFDQPELVKMYPVEEVPCLPSTPQKYILQHI